MTDKKKRVLVIAARFSNNLGDDIIFDVVAEVCRNVRGIDPIGLSISGRDIYTSNNTDEYSKESTLKVLFKKNPLYSVYVQKKGLIKLKQNLASLDDKDFDVIVFAGGQFFMDYFVYWISEIVKYAERKNKKVIFNCCGLGSLSSNSIVVLGKALKSKCVYSITLRDGKDRFSQLFQIRNVIQTVDPAICSANLYGQIKKEDEYVGIGIIDYQMIKKRGHNISETQYMNLIRKIIKYVEYKEKRIVCFTNGAISDHEFAFNILRSIHKNSLLADRPKRPIDLVNIVSECKYIISFRLHSLILAASYGIPSIGFAWDTKVRDFYNVDGRDKW